jgi:hypothetical protein
MKGRLKGAGLSSFSIAGFAATLPRRRSAASISAAATIPPEDGSGRACSRAGPAPPAPHASLRVASPPLAVLPIPSRSTEPRVAFSRAPGRKPDPTHSEKEITSTRSRTPSLALSLDRSG